MVNQRELASDFRSPEIINPLERIQLIGDHTDARRFTAQEVRAFMPHSDIIIATDFYCIPTGRVEEVRDEENVLIGLWHPEEGVLNVDHHSESPEHFGFVSSTNLAIRLMRDRLSKNERFRHGIKTLPTIVASHTDFDSIASAGILTGALEPLEEIYGKAAIAADHTGEPNLFGDVGNSLTQLRNVALSLRSLQTLRFGGKVEDLEPIAQTMVQELYERRKRIAELIRQGLFKKRENGVYYAQLQEDITGESLSHFFDDATVIVTATPSRRNEGKYNMRTRAGKLWPQGNSLQQMRLENWAGRWNGGSTERGGGTKDPEVFVQHIIQGVGKL